RIMHSRQQALKIVDVMQRQRAVDEIERSRWQFQPIQVTVLVNYRRVARLGARSCQHLFRNVDPENPRRSSFPRPAAEPAETAARVQPPLPWHLWQHGA